MTTEQASIACDLCESATYVEESIFLDCDHAYCQSCLTETIRLQCTLEAKCPKAGCQEAVCASITRSLLSPSDLENAEKQDLVRYVEQCPDMVIHCPSCAVLIEVSAEGSRGQTPTGPMKTSLRCRACHTEFCYKCHATPYHHGRSCTDYRRYSNAIKCRFCEVPIQKPSKQLKKISCPDNESYSLVCKSPDCRALAKVSCPRSLKCGHPCCGHVRDTPCPPCLHCIERADEPCSLCKISTLEREPTVHLSCGHRFHYFCISKRLEQGFGDSRSSIHFNFMNCVLCQSRIEHSLFTKVLLKYESMRSRVCHLLQHLEGRSFEESDMDVHLRKHWIFQCEACSVPFSAGLRSCGGSVDAEAGDAGSDTFVLSRLCTSCSIERHGHNCPTHGSEYVQYKCRFCCNVATWHCWGTHHFCADCHTKQANGAGLTKLTPVELPSCPGPELCPLDVPHAPPNGLEFPLGCSACRSMHEHLEASCKRRRTTE